jgi:hypothetical protein
LFTRPNERKALRRSFRSSGFRIPLKDYSAAALEASRVGWFRNMARKRWFKEKTYDLSIAELVREASNLSQIYQRDFEERACRARTLTGFDRKRAITKLRYLSSRLLLQERWLPPS